MAISVVKSCRIGVLAFTDNEPDWAATPTKPGLLYSPIEVDDERAAYLFGLIREGRKNADILLVSAHWGPNWGYSPPPEHPRFARALIDHGADVVFGHSGHVFRGIEIYKNRPILYCAGNFIDDYAVDEEQRNDESFLFLLDAAGNSFSRLRLYPTVIGQCQAALAGAISAQKIAFKMKALCEKLGTAADWNPEQRVLQIPLG